MGKYSRILIVDYGMFTGIAEKMASSGEFDEVLYYCPWKKDFPKLNDYLIGYGLPGVTKVYDFYEAKNKLDKEKDTIMFTDIYDADWQEDLRRQGYHVWGTGKAEKLEIERYSTRMKFKELGMPIPETELCKGIDELKECLEKEDDVWVKLSKLRGEQETFHYDKSLPAKQKILKLEKKIGSKLLEFIVEQPIEAVEYGYDGYVIDGKFPSLAIWGWEVKDCGYIGRIAKVEDMPEQIQYCNETIAELFSKSRGDYSNEIRGTMDGTPYLIDPTPRKPSPPSQCLQEAYANWPEIVYKGARGILVDPVPVCKFVAEVMVYSIYAELNDVEISYPKRFKKFVKTRNNCVIDGKEYIIARDVPMNIVCCLVGISNESLEDCFEQINEMADEISVEDKNVRLDSLSEAMKTVDKAKEFGIYFLDEDMDTKDKDDEEKHNTRQIKPVDKSEKQEKPSKDSQTRKIVTTKADSSDYAESKISNQYMFSNKVSKSETKQKLNMYASGRSNNIVSKDKNTGGPTRYTPPTGKANLSPELKKLGLMQDMSGEKEVTSGSLKPLSFTDMYSDKKKTPQLKPIKELWGRGSAF